MKKKILIIILSILVIICISLGLIFMFRKKNEVLPVISIEELNIVLKEDLTTNFLSDVHVSDFIESLNYTIVDDYKIDTTIIGDKEVIFDIISENKVKTRSSYTITIKDTTPPVVWLSSSKSVQRGSDIDLTESILCGDDYDDNPVCKVEGSYDLDSYGTYPLTFVATDSSGNTTSVNFNLVVTDIYGGGYYSDNTVYFSDLISKYKNDNTMIGLDISRWQGDVDFEALKEAGVEFVIIRVGSEDNEGRFIDANFDKYASEANRVGIPLGAYYYSYADSIEYAKEDAKYVLNAIKKYKFDFPIAFDWEDFGNFNSYNMSFYKLTSIAKAFLDEISANGYKAMNYGSKNYLEKIWLNTGYPTWLAQYNDEVTYNGSYSFWQLTDSVKVNGISGRADADIAYKNMME